MLYFILGILTGILLSFLSLILILWQKPNLERTLKQTESLLKPKGKILEPENEELTQWKDSLATDATSE